ncbi:hypothetical protein [Bradymonas sediminis]|uniref:Uncharacterized protein n=1 Tax=Bradymonas sediminis TaxID=1548548 RepID=A0A2Z4FGR8_9DELT|nr:hypothetical protein [Bradymonas sediminis]AWV87944.1 hypothetical protein DN745_00800 [Bradymonas sediminis]TDP62962.1 hypothetical protein DFR33_11195 [Bradymonas sediminis]
MNSPNYWYAFGCILIASICSAGCGHIDEDFDLSDEELRAKYELEMGGMGISGTGHVSGCGGFGYHRHRYGHGGYGIATASGDPTIALPDEGLSSEEAQRAAWVGLAIARRSADAQPDEDAPERLTGRRISTWGDYLAHEMERAERMRSK